MKAAWYERTGPAAEVLTLGEMPTPEPGPGEVRVRLACSGVNPSDVKTRSGQRSTTLPFPRIVPHSDGAGVIDRLGEGVEARRLGQPVWLWNAAWGRPHGTAAEYITLPEAQAVPCPEGLDMAAAACLGIPALTAWHAVHCGGGVAGRRVLVAGGAGSVGHYAVQMARLAGARQVIATTGSAEKARLALAAGADAALDYKTDDLPARMAELTGGAGIDRIIEVQLGGNIELNLDLIAPDGEMVVYGTDSSPIPVPFVPMIMRNVCLRFFIVYNLSPADRIRALSGVSSLVARGALTHSIGARLPLAEIARAHDMVDQRAVTGNVVLDIAP